MKRAIALLLTLLIIFALSLVMLKILNNNEKLLNYSSFDKDLAQLNILIKDINNQAIKYLKNANLKLPITLPFQYKNIQIELMLDEVDFNNSIVLDKNTNLDIEFLYDFKSLFKDKNISNFYQVEYIINKYINLTQDNSINRYNFLYPKIKNAKYLLDYSINYNDIKANVKLYISKDYNILDYYIQL